MASGWVVIRFTTIYLLLMYERTLYTLIKVQQYESKGTSYTRCDEWLSFWMFYETTVDSPLIDNDRLSGKYENIDKNATTRINESQQIWFSAKRCLFVFWHHAAMEKQFFFYSTGYFNAFFSDQFMAFYNFFIINFSPFLTFFRF